MDRLKEDEALPEDEAHSCTSQVGGARRLITYRYAKLIPMPLFSRFRVSKGLKPVQAPTSIQTNALEK